jgi:penicillin-binding protein 1A
VWIGNDNNAPMIHATGGTLPARLFKAFMEDAEQDRAARPLTSLKLAPPPSSAAVATVASAEAPTLAQTAAAVQPEPEKPATFEDVLNSLFSGK